ncbi:MAG: response regulator [Cyanobacteria bacterium P01_B01_bin.77]
MRAEVATSNVLISELDHKIQLAKQKQLTGILAIKSGPIHQWRLYFLAGQLVWANTHTHTKRRWYRHLLQHRSDLLKHGLNTYLGLTYNRLARLVICKQFSRQLFSDIVTGCILEVLFDLQRQGTLNFQETGKGLTYCIKSQKACDSSYLNLQNIRLWTQAKHEWQAWENAELAQVNPNDALVIRDLASLEDLAYPRLFKLLSALVDGDQTLRDLALKINQPLIPFVRLVLPHIYSQALQLKSVEDKVTKSSVITAQNDAVVKLAQATIPKDARIVYVNDSLADNHKMATIIEAAGYRYSNIADPLEVLKQLAQLKPKLIFLNLMMPVVNGYELCAQIRRMSDFKQTPIVMVAGGNSIAERMRAKLVGASEFVSKPIKPKNVLKTLILLDMI